MTQHSLFIKSRNTLTSEHSAYEQRALQLSRKLAFQITTQRRNRPKPVAKRRRFRKRPKRRLYFFIKKGKRFVRLRRRLSRRARKTRLAYRRVVQAPLPVVISNSSNSSKVRAKLRVYTWLLRLRKRNKLAGYRISRKAHLRFRLRVPKRSVYRRTVKSRKRFTRLLRAKLRATSKKLLKKKITKLGIFQLQLRRHRVRRVLKRALVHPWSHKLKLPLALPKPQVLKRAKRARVCRFLPITPLTAAVWNRALTPRAPASTAGKVLNLHRTGKVVRATAKLERERLRKTKRKAKTRRTRRPKSRPRATKYLMAFPAKRGPYAGWRRKPSRIFRRDVKRALNKNTKRVLRETSQSRAARSLGRVAALLSRMYPKLALSAGAMSVALRTGKRVQPSKIRRLIVKFLRRSKKFDHGPRRDAVNCVLKSGRDLLFASGARKKIMPKRPKRKGLKQKKVRLNPVSKLVRLLDKHLKLKVSKKRKFKRVGRYARVFHRIARGGKLSVRRNAVVVRQRTFLEPKTFLRTHNNPSNLPGIPAELFAPQLRLRRVVRIPPLKMLASSSRVSTVTHLRRAGRPTRRLRIIARKRRCKPRRLRTRRWMRRQNRMPSARRAKRRRSRITRRLHVLKRAYRIKGRVFVRLARAATHKRYLAQILRPYGRTRRKIIGVSVRSSFCRDNRVRVLAAKLGRFRYIREATRVRGVMRRRLRRLSPSARLRLTRRTTRWARRRYIRKLKFSTGRMRKNHKPTVIWRNWRAKLALVKKKRALKKRVRRAVQLCLRYVSSTLHRATAISSSLSVASADLIAARLNTGALQHASRKPPARRQSEFSAKWRAVWLNRARKNTAKRNFRRSVRAVSRGKLRYRRRFLIRKAWRRRRRQQRLKRYSLVSNFLTDAQPGYVSPRLADDVKQTVTTRLTAGAPVSAWQDQQKLKFLLLVKHLLRSNQFTKLSQLSLTGALGQHTDLGKLELLFALGFLTEALKQKLLLQVAADIRVSKGASIVCDQYAVTRSVNVRDLLSYTAPEVSYRDEDFFIKDKPSEQTRALKKKRRVEIKRRLRRVFGKRRRLQTIPEMISVRLALPLVARLMNKEQTRTVSKNKRHAGRKRKGRSTMLGRAPRSSAPSTQRARAKRLFLEASKVASVYRRGTRHGVHVHRLWVRRHGRWHHRAASSSNAFLRNNFSIARPWGFKSKFQKAPRLLPRLLVRTTGPLTRLLDKVRSTRRMFRGYRTYRRILGQARALTYRRAVAHLPTKAHFRGRKFWVSASRKRVDDPARAHLKFYRKGEKIPEEVVASAAQEVGPTPIKVEQAKARYHKGLKFNAFDALVHKHLNAYYKFSEAERQGPRGYESLCCALRSARSCRERESKITDDQYNGQITRVTDLLKQVAGCEVTVGALPKWGQLPKNIAAAKLPPAAITPVQISRRDSFEQEGNLTQADLSYITSSESKDKVHKYIMTPAAERDKLAAFVLLKKAALSTWTEIEDAHAADPKSSPRYIDLLVIRKALRQYNLELSLTSKDEARKALDSKEKKFKNKKSPSQQPVKA